MTNRTRRVREPVPLFVCEPGGLYAPAPDGAVIRAAFGAVTRALARGPVFGSPEAARRYLPALLGWREFEVFCVAHLDRRHRLIDLEEMFRGTVDGASVHPREVVRSVIAHNSAAVILIHNHPSGAALESQADVEITRRLREALALVDCPVLDHMIVGGSEVCSLSEKGLM